MLFNYAPSVFIIAQSDKFRMPQPICIGPFEEFNLSNRLWPQPNCFRHLRRVQCVTPL